MGAFGAATQIGGALSPLVVIPLQQRFGWRASFYLFALCGMVWAVAWYAWFRDSPAEKRGVDSRRARRDRRCAAATDARAALVGRAATQEPLGPRRELVLRRLRGVLRDLLDADLSRQRTRLHRAELRWTAAIWIAGIFGNSLGGVLSDALVARMGLTLGRRTAAIASSAVIASVIGALAATRDKPATIALLCVLGVGWGLSRPTGSRSASTSGAVTPARSALR